MKKGIIVNRLIHSIIITLLLFHIYNLTPNRKIILTPFLICSISILLKNIFLLMNNKKYIELFNKIYTIGFSLFWFSFLIYWCYISIKDKDFSLLLFSTPFWISGIYTIKNKLIKPPTNKISSKKTKINFKIIISSLMVLVALSSGILMLFLGIKDTYKLNKQTKDYLTTDGYYKNYEIFNNNKNETTYKLTYIYKVNNKEYSITTNYGTNYIPQKNTIRKVKYNPNNPNESILVGTNNKNGLIFIGTFFTLGSLTFVIFGLTVLGIFDKFKINIIGTYIGVVFTIIGVGIIIFQTKTTMSLIETIKSFGLWILIPFMFIIVGIYQIIKCLFSNNNQKK